MSTRKRDDLDSGYLYRVVMRAKGSDDEWEHTSYGHYGKPRTYMTVGAARSMKTRMERAHQQHLSYQYRGDVKELEFAVQKSPVTEWVIVP